MFLEKRHEIGPLRADPQDSMSATRSEDHGRAGVGWFLACQMHSDRRIVDVEDVQDFRRFAFERGVVAFRLLNSLSFQMRRVRRIERQHRTARQNGLRYERLSGGVSLRV